MRITLPAMILLACQIGHGADGTANLLVGDTGFEAGGIGWPASSCPWSFEGDHPSYWRSRGGVGFADTIAIVADDAGGSCLMLGKPTQDQEWTAMVQGRTARLHPGRHHLSLRAACADGAAHVRIALCQATRTNRGQLCSGRVEVGTTWQRVGVDLEVPAEGEYVILIEVLEAHRVRLDDIALHAGAEEAYAPPLPLTLGLAAAPPLPTPLPNLLFAGEDDRTLPCILRAAAMAPLPGPIALAATIEEVDGSSRQLDLGVLDSTAVRCERRIGLPIPGVGIWRVRLTASAGGHVIGDSGPVQLARILPHMGPADPFFGLHPFWDPLIAILGAGTIRDMNLITWSRIQPTREAWIPPPADLLEAMRTSGRRFLVTLVGEQPGMHGKPWQLHNWGITDWMNVPLWAGSGTTVHGLSGEAMIPTPEALAEYTTRVVGLLRGIPVDYEVVNEPLHYMPAEDYARILKTAWTAIKAADPSARVVAAASPPMWSQLSQRPYAWYDELFAAGALQWCDAVSLHPYDNGNVPEFGYDGRGEEAWTSGLAAVMERHGGRKPLLISEKGYEAPAWGPNLEARARGRVSSHNAADARAEAAWMVRSYVAQRQAGMESVVWFNRPSTQRGQGRFLPWDGELYGLVGADQSPKPSLVAYAAMTGRLTFARPLGRLDLPPAMRGFSCDRAGTPVLVLWQWSNEEVRPGVHPSPATVLPPAAAGTLALWDTWGRPIASSPEGLSVGTDPIYVEPASPVADAAAWCAAWNHATVRGLPLAEVVGVRLRSGATGMEIVAGIRRLGSDPVTVTLACGEGSSRLTLDSTDTGTVHVAINPPSGSGALPVTIDLGDGRGPIAFPLWHATVPGRIAIAQASHICVFTDEFRVWRNPADCSAEIRTSWTPSSLRIEVTVHDDVLWANPEGRRAWNGDAVELFLDPHPASAALRRALGPGAMQAVIPARSGIDGPTIGGGALRRHVAVDTVPGGYRCMIDVPAAALGLPSFTDGQVIGFDLVLDDADSDQGRKIQMAWAGTAENHKDSSRWGHLILRSGDAP